MSSAGWCRSGPPSCPRRGGRGRWPRRGRRAGRWRCGCGAGRSRCGRRRPRCRPTRWCRCACGWWRGRRSRCRPRWRCGARPRPRSVRSSGSGVGGLGGDLDGLGDRVDDGLRGVPRRPEVDVLDDRQDVPQPGDGVIEQAHGTHPPSCRRWPGSRRCRSSTLAWCSAITPSTTPEHAVEVAGRIGQRGGEVGHVVAGRLGRAAARILHLGRGAVGVLPAVTDGLGLRTMVMGAPPASRREFPRRPTPNAGPASCGAAAVSRGRSSRR